MGARIAAPPATPADQINDETWSETAFYGFTHRGFYNLTRKADDSTDAMDPLQVRVRNRNGLGVEDKHRQIPRRSP